jgi:hypothetical protein
MLDELKQYIKDNLEIEKDFPLFKRAKQAAFGSSMMMDMECCAAPNIDTFIEDNKDKNKFQTLLFNYIDERNLKDSDVYNKVNIDRRLFSKIRNENYHPSKETVILLGLALELNEDEFERLLESAAYSLPKNNTYDLIIRFCFINKIYNLFQVNEFLDNYKLKTL